MHADREQHPPARHVGQPLGEVRIGEGEHQRAEQLADRIALLQDAGDDALWSAAGIDSSASDAPIPHSPPMTKPNRVRSMSRAMRLGAKAEASSSTE